jgi:hypothetical protein
MIDFSHTHLSLGNQIMLASEMRMKAVTTTIMIQQLTPALLGAKPYSGTTCAPSITAVSCALSQIRISVGRKKKCDKATGTAAPLRHGQTKGFFEKP